VIVAQGKSSLRTFNPLNRCEITLHREWRVFSLKNTESYFSLLIVLFEFSLFVFMLISALNRNSSTLLWVLLAVSSVSIFFKKSLNTFKERGSLSFLGLDISKQTKNQMLNQNRQVKSCVTSRQFSFEKCQLQR